MGSHYSVDMLPGREGDCIWIEYGETDQTPHRILIDGGRQIAYETLKARFSALPDNEKKFDLLVLTHVDADHVEGLLKLLEDPDLDIEFDDVWFNGFDHLSKPTGLETFGAVQGERFTAGLLKKGWPWNKAFNKGSVVVPDSGELPVLELPGGMEITLLGPNWHGLERYESTWVCECKKAGMIPGFEARREELGNLEAFGPLNADVVRELANEEYKKDSSPANATSIAFLAEYKGKRALFTGDAPVETILPNWKRLSDKKTVDAFKLSHHGSKGTTSKELIAEIECSTYLISTDGSRHQHPDREAIARVLVSQSGPKTLVCNFDSAPMQIWSTSSSLKEFFDYEVIVPKGADPQGVIRTVL